MCFLSTTPGGDQHDPKLISNTFPSFLTPSHRHLLYCCWTQSIIIVYLARSWVVCPTYFAVNLPAIISCQSCLLLSSSSSSFAAFGGKQAGWSLILGVLSHLLHGSRTPLHQTCDMLYRTCNWRRALLDFLQDTILCHCNPVANKWLLWNRPLNFNFYILSQQGQPVGGLMSLLARHLYHWVSPLEHSLQFEGSVLLPQCQEVKFMQSCAKFSIFSD